jgi:hypothetical protein
MKSITDKTMTPMFWIGAAFVAACSWLLAVAVIASVVMKRPLTQFEVSLS